MAAASVCGPAAVAMPSAARVGGFRTAPAGVEFAVAVIVPVAAAVTSICDDWLTDAAFWMDASVVALIVGAATVVPVVATAATPSAVATTIVSVAASSVTVPVALTVVLFRRRLRAIVLMTGSAVPFSTAPAPGTALASTVELTFDVALAVKAPAAVMVEFPVTTTSADTLASSAAAGMGATLVTLETSVALAFSVMSSPVRVAPLTLTAAITFASGSVSGVTSVPTAPRR